MKWKITAATLAAAAIVSAPLAGAKPGNGNGNKPVTPPGKTISAIAKSGGGAAGVLGALVQLKPTNTGLQNALRNATATRTTTPAPTTSNSPSPTTDTPAPTTSNSPAPTTDTPSPTVTVTPTATSTPTVTVSPTVTP